VTDNQSVKIKRGIEVENRMRFLDVLTISFSYISICYQYFLSKMK